MIDSKDLLNEIMKILENQYFKGQAGKTMTKDVAVYFNTYFQDVADLAGIIKEMWSLGHVTPLIAKKTALMLNRSLETIILASVGQGLVAQEKAKALVGAMMDETLQLLLQFILGI
ncbi:MAG: hypothetical protein CME68_02620 [Halobacteriovoraceae bacterium]|nr:hypothetical protein [Halobacteriovoraceae bacterium]|tara:strand:- start:530 stop:877 length:348 start_codon:yes stop_codon:yes gene_type:complete